MSEAASDRFCKCFSNLETADIRSAEPSWEEAWAPPRGGAPWARPVLPRGFGPADLDALSAEVASWQSRDRTSSI